MDAESKLEAPPRLAVYIIALNEANHIRQAVESARVVAEVVVVVDGGSDDDTVDSATAAGGIVWQRAFDSFAAQRNWTLDKIADEIGPSWILALDADERISPQLATELDDLLTQDPDEDVFLVPRWLTFQEKVLRFAGTRRTRLPRLFRPDAGRYEDREVNEHFTPRVGTAVGRLRGPILHEDVVSWERHIAKHNRYSTLEARARLARDAGTAANVTLGEAISRSHLRRRWMREHLFERVPGKPIVRFLYLYVVRGGFLDGRAGLNNAVFQSWLEMSIQEKYRELRRPRA